MSHFVGLDVSLQSTSICIVDKTGKVLREGKVASTPKAIAVFLRSLKLRYACIGLEVGALSRWLCVGLKRARLRAVCIEARHASLMLKGRRNKTDRNDAHGIAQMMRVGLYVKVHIKTLPSQEIRSLLSARRILQVKCIDVQNCIRGLLRACGLKLGRVSRIRFSGLVSQHLRKAPLLRPNIEPLLAVWEAMKGHFELLDAKMVTLANSDPICQLLMTAPGVGPFVSLTFRAAVDDPARFQHSRSVGAHFGMTARVQQSGETQWLGKITKFGDESVRAALYDAATAILRPATKSSYLKVWGLQVAQSRGMSKAKVGVARRLSVVLHRMWMDMEPFRWSAESIGQQ
jgi:transposase